MEQLILILFVLVCAAMVGLILLQQGKGADMGASFGSGGSQTMFGPSGGGNVLTRATSILAVLFFAGCFALAVIARDRARSSLDDGIPIPAVQESRAVPAEVEAALERIQEEIPATIDAPTNDEEIPVLPDA